MIGVQTIPGGVNPTQGDEINRREGGKRDKSPRGRNSPHPDPSTCTQAPEATPDLGRVSGLYVMRTGLPSLPQGA